MVTHTERKREEGGRNMCVKSLQTRAEAGGSHVSVRYKTYEAAARANHTHTIYIMMSHFCSLLFPPSAMPLLPFASSFNSMFVCPRGNINFCCCCCCCCIGNNYLLDTKTHRYNVCACVCVFSSLCCFCLFFFSSFLCFFHVVARALL